MNDLEDRVRDCLRVQGARAQIVDLTTAARRRSRQLGRRRVLAIGGALPVAAAAATALGTAFALTIGSAPPALAAVTSALTRTLTRSYHLSVQSGGYYGRNGRITYGSPCTTKVDPVRHLEETSCPNGEDTREVGGYVYTYFFAPLEGTGKHWQRMSTTCLVSLDTPFGIAVNDLGIAVSPQQMLPEIKKAGKVTVVGPASGPGWTGTRYALTTMATQQERVSGTVDVDQQGRARNLVLTERLASSPRPYVYRLHLAFSDFGARVTVTPPPADQTIQQSC